MKTIKYLLIELLLFSLTSCMVRKADDTIVRSRPYYSHRLVNGYSYVHDRPPIN